jgi:predicted alpha/beta hydrolase
MNDGSASSSERGAQWLRVHFHDLQPRHFPAALDERALRSNDQSLGPAPPREFLYQQFGLPLAATVAAGQVDVADAMVIGRSGGFHGDALGGTGGPRRSSKQARRRCSGRAS